MANDDLKSFRWATLADATDYLDGFFKSGHHPVRLDNKTTVRAVNMKTKNPDFHITDLDDSAPYSWKYVCKHFGSNDQKSKISQDAEGQQKASRNRAAVRKGCRFAVYVAWSKDDKCYSVKSCQLDHNHEISSELYKMYASSRRLNADARQNASDMLAVGAKPTLVANLLQQQDLTVTTKDMYNLRQLLKFKGTTEEELLDVIRQHNLKHSIHTDSTDRVTCISWSSPQQLALLSSYSEVLMLDATYKCNNIRMPLFTLAIVDKFGHGQPVAHALLAREDVQHISQFLHDVLAWYPGISTATFITDKDFAEINAIRSVCPNAQIFLCRFHIMKAFVEEINKQAPSDSETLLQLLRKLLYSTNQSTYNETLTYIQQNYSSFHQYLAANWTPHETLYAGYARHGILHFDNHTNNRLERYHHTIKSVLGSSQVSVGTLVDRLHKLISVRSLSMQQQEFEMRMKHRQTDNPTADAYSKNVTPFAAKRIEVELSKSASTKHVVEQLDDDVASIGNYQVTVTSCTCDSFTSFNLPCRHIFRLRKIKTLPAFDMHLVHDRWLIGTTVNNVDISSQHTDIDIVSAEVPVSYATAAQRFKTAMSLLTPMASTLAELPPRKFLSCMTWLGQMEKKVRDGTWAHDVCPSSTSTQNSPSDGDSTSGEPVLQPSISNTAHSNDTPDDETDNTQITMQDNSQPSSSNTARSNDVPDVEPDNNQVVTQNNSQSETAGDKRKQFKLPTKVASRGRPQQTRQRRFRLKNNSSSSGASSVATQGTDATDNCAECGQINPSKRKRGCSKVINWIQCDDCGFWYHVACVESVPANDNDQFSCSRCVNA